MNDKPQEHYMMLMPPKTQSGHPRIECTCGAEKESQSMVKLGRFIKSHTAETGHGLVSRGQSHLWN